MEDRQQMLVDMIQEYCDSSGEDVGEVFSYIANNMVRFDDDAFIAYTITESGVAEMSYFYSRKPFAGVKLARVLEQDFYDAGIRYVRMMVRADIVGPMSKVFPDYHLESVVMAKELVTNGEPIREETE